MDELMLLDCDVFALANEVLDTYPCDAEFEDFGAYHSLKFLGKGGMGEVFSAEDHKTGRRVAIKFIRNVWNEPELRQRFQREVMSLAQLEHAAIARLYEAGVHPNGTPYFSMELVDGTPLDEYCDRNKCSLAERIRLFQSVCGAVRYAHSRAVVHLDLKPSNILVTADGRAKLLDFGVASQLGKIDEPGDETEMQVRFTPAFAAPEQVFRQPVGTYTDVYSLGAILYGLLAGRPLHQLSSWTGIDAEAWIRADDDLEKPSTLAQRKGAGRMAWSDLDALCLAALKKNPEDRYHSVVELNQDLEHYLKGERLRVRRDTIGYRLAKFAGRHQRSIIAGAAVGLILFGLTGFYLMRLERARNAELAQALRTQRVQKFVLSLFGSNEAGPPDSLRVVSLLDTGVRNAELLNKEPAVQSDLYETLGNIFELLGKLDRADLLLKSGMNLRRSTFGGNSEEVAESMVSLGYLRIDQGQFVDGDRLIRQALEIYRHKLPADNPAIGRALTGLGSNLFHQGKLNESITVLNEAVRILSEPGAEQADLVESLTYLAGCRQHLGNNSAAYSVFQRILLLDGRIYGDRHPRVAEDLSNLAEAEAGLGKYREAEQHDNQAIEIERNWYGREHPETGITTMGLGKSLVLAGKYDEGSRVLQEALSVLERSVGKVHPFVGVDLEWQGVAALKQGHLVEAEADFQRMAAVSKSVYGEDSGHRAKISFRFGELEFARRDYEAAESLFRDAAKRFSATFAPDSSYTAAARIRLGSTLVCRQKYVEAEAELLAGYEVVTRESQSAPGEAREARRSLVALYEALKLPEKAARFSAGL